MEENVEKVSKKTELNDTMTFQWHAIIRWCKISFQAERLLEISLMCFYDIVFVFPWHSFVLKLYHFLQHSSLFFRKKNPHKQMKKQQQKKKTTKQMKNKNKKQNNLC